MKDDQPAYIIHYYFKRLNKNAERLKKDPIDTGFDEETIHQFRVDVKKLRAFLRMIRTGIDEPGHLKFPHRFKKMYLLTGQIRDRQLCIKRIREHDVGKKNKVPKKIAALEKELNELTDKKEDLLDKKEFSEIEGKIIENIPGLPENLLIRNFFAQKLNDITEITTKAHYSDKELHTIRKNLKDIIYIISIFRDDIKAPLPFSFWTKQELKRTEKLSHTLGLFNDACIALSFLKPAEIKKEITEEKNHLISMRRKWLEEKRKLKKEILGEMPGLRLNIF